jgi:hypothetical protein
MNSYDNNCTSSGAPLLELCVSKDDRLERWYILTGRI